MRIMLRDYYTESGCCGDSHEIELEAESAADLARQIAGTQYRIPGWQWDFSDVQLVQDPPIELQEEIASAIPAAMESLKAAEAAAEQAKKTKKRAEERANGVRVLRAELERLRADLTPKAITKREAAIAALESE